MQVKVRSQDNLGKFTEKLLTTSELSEFLSQRQHTIERTDSVESREATR